MDEKLKLTRRKFLQVSAAAGAVAAAGGIELAAHAAPDEEAKKGELKYVRTTCAPNCTGGCGQQACVYNGEIKDIIQASDYEDSEHNPRGRHVFTTERSKISFRHRTTRIPSTIPEDV